MRELAGLDVDTFKKFEKDATKTMLSKPLIKISSYGQRQKVWNALQEYYRLYCAPNITAFQKQTNIFN